MPVMTSAENGPTAGVAAGVQVQGSSSSSSSSSSCSSNNSHQESPSLCAGCAAKIVDRYYLLAVDRQWHVQCLKCCECKLRLDSELTCFARQGNIYCKEDYYRLFAVKRCARCHLGISSNELVMRARELVYHLHCFNCASCHKALTKGEHFGIRDNLVYCRVHYEMISHHHHNHHHHNSNNHHHHHQQQHLHYLGAHLHPHHNHNQHHQAEYAVVTDIEGAFRSAGMGASGANSGPNGRHPYYMNAAGGGTPTASGGGGGNTGVQKGRPRKRKVPEADMTVLSHNALELLPNGAEMCGLDATSSGAGSGYETTPPPPGAPVGGQQPPRTKRMRTSFKHHQLRTMKSYFALNQNPDAKDLKQLAQKTGLSKRVLQVWFQNARAKWRRNMMRQEAQGVDKSGETAASAAAVTELGNSGRGLGVSADPLTPAPTPLGDMPPALGSDSHSPPSLGFGDLY